MNRTSSFLRLVSVEIDSCIFEGQHGQPHGPQYFIFSDTECESQIVRYGHVVGACGRPRWSRSLVNRTSSFLLLVFGEIYTFAMWRAEVGNQMHQNHINSL